MTESKILTFIEERDVRGIVDTFFIEQKISLNQEFMREGPYWDFKRDLPPLGRHNSEKWASIAADVLAFTNHQGGIIFFGIDESQGFSVSSVSGLTIDSKLFNDQIRKFVGDSIFVSYQQYILKQKTKIGIALIQKGGINPVRFKMNSPNSYFSVGDLAVRKGDETRIFRGDEIEIYLQSIGVATSSKEYVINVPFFKILWPEFSLFVPRRELQTQVMEGLHDERSSIVYLIGPGGNGKTSLAIQTLIDCKNAGEFEFIVSISAKDRALTETGINSVESKFDNFESLLDAIIDTLDFDYDWFPNNIPEKEQAVLATISGTKGLIFIDNLETIEDKRVYDFITKVPYPNKVLVTSRTQKIKRRVFDITVGSLNKDEAEKLLSIVLKNSRSKINYTDISPIERNGFLENCFRIPLAIEWICRKAKTKSELLSMAAGLRTESPNADEYLEFTFRNVYEELLQDGKELLHALSIIENGLCKPELQIILSLTNDKFDDAIEALSEANLVQTSDYQHGSDIDIYYKLNFLVSRFVYNQVRRDKNIENKIRHQAKLYYEAEDIKDHSQRIQIATARQKGKDFDAVYIEMGIRARYNGQVTEAQKNFRNAIAYNSKNWKAHKELAETIKTSNQKEALHHFREAVKWIHKSDPKRWLVLREAALCLRRSGIVSDMDCAISYLDEALKMQPSDIFTRTVLGECYASRFVWDKVIEVFRDYEEEADPTSGPKIRSALLRAFQNKNEILKVQEINHLISKLDSKAS